MTTPQPDAQPLGSGGLSRRKILLMAGAGMAGISVAACSPGSSSSSATSSSATRSTSPGGSSSASGPPSPGPSATGTVITSVSKVPVGGAAIVDTGGTGFVVSQKTAGDVACYSAVCPHEGCLCSSIQGDDVVCPCHGSRFNIFTGDVVQGPATKGLAKVGVTVSGGNVVGS